MSNLALIKMNNWYVGLTKTKRQKLVSLQSKGIQNKQLNVGAITVPFFWMNNKFCFEDEKIKSLKK